MKPEERLRDALAATAELVAPKDPLPDVPSTTVPLRRRRGRQLVPVAVAASVALVITVGVQLAPRPAPRPAPPLGSGDPLQARYFVSNVDDLGTKELAVRDVRTGKVVATHGLPSGSAGEWDAVSATADPRVFYATAVEPAKGKRQVVPPTPGHLDGGARKVPAEGRPLPRGEVFVLRLQERGRVLAEPVGPGRSTSRVYRLTIDDAGRIRTLRPVATLPDKAMPAYFAASPDGKRVAYAVETTTGEDPYGPAKIGVLDLSTGRRTEHTTKVTGHVSALSWTDGRRLAFSLVASTDGSDGLRVFDTRTGRDLVADSRVLARYRGDVPADPVLGDDGRNYYLVEGHQGPRGRVTRIREVAAGAPCCAKSGGRVVHQWAYTGEDDGTDRPSTLLVRDIAGTALLAVDDTGRARRIDIASGRAVTFPFPRGVPNSIAW